MSKQRHKWSEPVRFANKTERTCVRCPAVRVTRHEAGRSWVEFWSGGEAPERLEKRPPCERAGP